ncbi:MAG: hypothetical protein NVSMB13_10690 [Mycobacteriales bacterium]
MAWPTTSTPMPSPWLPPGPAEVARAGSPRAPRKRHRTLRELPLIAVLVLGGVGLLIINHRTSTGYPWRRGLFVVAAAPLLGALLRLVLPPRQAGMLVVRSRGVDVALLAGLGLAVLVLTVVVPTS